MARLCGQTGIAVRGEALMSDMGTLYEWAESLGWSDGPQEHIANFIFRHVADANQRELDLRVELNAARVALDATLQQLQKMRALQARKLFYANSKRLEMAVEFAKLYIAQTSSNPGHIARLSIWLADELIRLTRTDSDTPKDGDLVDVGEE